MKFKTSYIIGILAALIILGVDIFFFFGTRWFIAGVIVAISIGWMNFWIDLQKENNRQKEIENQFLEFVRNLVESVKSGISIPKSIMLVAKKDYRSLNPYVKKLSNQIEWGIPTRKALNTFSFDTNNPVISRSINIIIEAEQSGGDIRDILSSVVDSVINVKKMKEERKSSVFSQIVQGYVIFFVFIIIMLVLQVWLFPKIVEVSGSIQSGLSGLGAGGTGASFNLDSIFFSLILIQGFFAGLMIGKFSEGTLKRGLIHSLILMTAAALIITTVKGGI